MIKDQNTFKLFLKNNLLYASEVTKILEISRSTLSLLKKNGELPAVIESTSGDIFLKQDVRAYLDRKNKLASTNLPTPKFHDTKTELNQDELQQNLAKMGRIETIYAYFDQDDAIIDGFYFIDDDKQLGALKWLQAPRLILIDEYGEQYWLHCGTAGYIGGGSRRTEEILQSLPSEGPAAVPEIPGELIELIFKHHIVKFVLDGIEWRCYPKQSMFLTKNLKEKVPASLYWYNDHLVLLQMTTPNGEDNEDTMQMLKHYSEFIKNPVSFIFYPNIEEAMKVDRFNPTDSLFNSPEVYQLIIKDISGRELWLALDIYSQSPFHKPQSLKALLEYCGFNVNEQGISGRFIEWLKVRISNNTEPIQGTRDPVRLPHKAIRYGIKY
ncbi:hypothetical protein IAQ67_15620 [Paenibacillus peoriae]|uniref:Helix-turn-helix domain-containing protein n=1 Tax=Paenibacillus peoriae TaxID=59893 RepID=A0A7H0Y2L7_9BACL|nr:hypothetical protein [Paenibacillus peoriae]QNR65325.1 hypothetical protein IAQ67_15620 [Paenibacillus peoriae]